jgi:hypothetical protein
MQKTASLGGKAMRKSTTSIARVSELLAIRKAESKM